MADSRAEQEAAEGVDHRGEGLILGELVDTRGRLRMADVKARVELRHAFDSLVIFLTLEKELETPKLTPGPNSSEPEYGCPDRDVT